MRTTATRQLLCIGAGLLLALPLSALQSRTKRASGAVTTYDVDGRAASHVTDSGT
jgi:hypothetical protein